MDNEIERDYQEERRQREYWEQLQRDESEYFSRLEAGMCPFCESMDTVSVSYQYQACAERYCYDCGSQYVAEW